MIDIKDVQELFSYLMELHPNSPPDKIPRLTRSLAQTWVNATTGYTKEQLFRAAREHAHRCRFWPDLSEILAQLPKLPEGEQRRYAPPGEAERESMEKLRAWQQEWHQELRERGLPTMREALDQGMSLAQWNALLQEAGVWD